MSGEERASICRICKENCGILVSDNGRSLEIKGNPEHPISRGFLCFRGKNYGEVHRSSKRLTEPLLRRGTGWEKISYEDALDVLASKFQKCKERYGAQSVVFYKGEALKHQEIAEYMRHLSYGFGSPNYATVGSLCYHGIWLAFKLTIGGIPQPAPERMKVAIFWGANPAVSLPRTMSVIKKAARNGAKIIVIDPLRTQTANHADLHLPIVPGSDGLLALAFLKYAIEQEALKPDFPESGWQELDLLVRGAGYNELLAGTGVSKADFQLACELIFSNLPGWIQTGSGLELKPSGVQTIRAIASLQSLLDPRNRPGNSFAELVPLPGAGLYPPMAVPVGGKEVPVFTTKSDEAQGMYLPRAILQGDPYPVRAMLVAGGNPLLTFPNSRVYRKAFESLDFLAVFDLFMTPTCECAHLVLPAANFLETLELHDYGSIARPFLGLTRPVVSDTKGWPAWKLIFELARRLGLEDLFPWKDNEEALQYRLSRCGVSLDSLLKSPSAAVAYTPPTKPGDGWSTPDGKVHYRSELVERTGCPSLPISDSLALPMTTDEEYPMWLSTGDRLPYFQHSQFRDNPAHRAAMEMATLGIHPQAAAASGIKEGDAVFVSTRYGKIEVRVMFDPGLRGDCLAISHGWIEANANELTDFTHSDPISGFPWMRTLPARIEKREG